MGRKKKEETEDGNKNINDSYIQAIKDIAKGSYSVEVGTLEDMEETLMPTGYVPTGDDFLDFIVSNRKNGGFPLGKYINIYSEEGVGKSLLVAKLIGNVQKMGGRAVIFDTERATYPPFMEVLGVQKDKLIYISKVNTVEKIFATIVSIIHNYLEKGADYPFIIAIDSMTMVQTEEGAKLDDWDGSESGYGEGAAKQKMLGNSLKKIHGLIKQDKIMLVTTDQVRDNFNKAGKFDRATSDTSGWAQRYYSDVRIELRRASKLKNPDKEQIGNKVKAEVVKSRISPAYRHSFLYLYNTRGMDNYASWIENGKLYGILGKGKTIDVPNVDGNLLLTEDGKKPDKKYLKYKLSTDKEFRNFLYDKISEVMIREYEAYSEAQFVDMEGTYEEEEEVDTKGNKSKLKIQSSEGEDGETEE